jgi:hypothetical protein
LTTDRTGQWLFKATGDGFLYLNDNYCNNGGWAMSGNDYVTGFSVGINRFSISGDSSYLYAIDSTTSEIKYIVPDKTTFNNSANWTTFNSDYQFRMVKANYDGSVVYGVTTTDELIKISGFSY